MARQKEEKSPRASRESITGKPSTGHDRKMTDVASEPNSFAPQRAQAGMSRASESVQSSGGGRIQRLASAIRGLFQRNKGSEDREMPIESTVELGTAGSQRQARVVRRETDIPMDALANTYTPQQTSLKGGFRDDGKARSRDQEFATGTADTGWNDEDHYTNKSNDPRIGTHGRTYEAGETREESRE
jgi:hypothetical protein